MLENIEVKDVLEYFPSNVRHKILRLNVLTIKDLSEIDLHSLNDVAGLRIKSRFLLTEVITELKNEPEHIITYWNESKRVFTIPSEGNSRLGIGLLTNAITEYFSLKNEESILSALTYYYALNQQKSYNTEEISHFLDYSTQGVRQLIKKGLTEIKSVFENDNEPSERIHLTQELRGDFKVLGEVLSRNEFHSDLSINRELNQAGLIFSDLNRNTLRLITDMFDLNTCGAVETNFTQATLYVNKNLEKSTVVTTASALVTCLTDSILSLSEMDVVIQVRKKKRKANIADIERLCAILPEIEVFESKGFQQIQIAFTSLGNARDRAFRILHDKGESMYLDDIVSEVNRKMVEGGNSRLYTRHTLALASDNRFRSKQKTGYWDLTEWEQNSDTIDQNVKMALIKLNEPSSYEEIIVKIHEERPELKVKSLRARIGKLCLLVEGDKFILPEWRNKYSGMALAKKKHRINTGEHDKTKKFRDEIINRILRQPNRTIDASVLIKDLVENGVGHTSQRIYKMLNDQSIFRKHTKSNSQIQISLVQNSGFERIGLDELNWIRVKQVIARELQETFKDDRQPAYSLTFSDCLESFKKVLDYECSEDLLNGLSERIIPSIDKYYANPDRNDRLNILKQLLTSLDPFLKKVLLLSSPSDYAWIKHNKKGLGDVIGKLSKLDPRDNRFAVSERVCSVNRWGKELNKVYQNRNIDTHNAKNYSDTQINSIINATIVIMLYSIFEYESQINSSI